MFGEIYVQKKTDESLQSFYECFCTVFRVALGHMRDSENYACGYYYRVDALGLQIEIAQADDSELPEYEFAITFEPRLVDNSKEPTMEGLGDIVAKELAVAGYSVLRVLGPPSQRTLRKCLVDSSGTGAEFVKEA
jgi:hypothetical protein